MEKKKRLAEAKTEVIQGATLKEASEKTGLSIDTLKRKSTKEKWIELQENYFQNVTTEMITKRGKAFLKNRIKLFDNLGEIYILTAKELTAEPDGKKIKVYGDIADILKKCISGQAELLGEINARDLYIEQTKIRESEEPEAYNRTINIKVVGKQTSKAYSRDIKETEFREE